MQVGRNDPCPCGSGKKYKKCCMHKDNVVQLKQVHRERFERQKDSLLERLHDFLDDVLTYSEEQRLKTRFKNRMNRDMDPQHLDIFFRIWLAFFHVYKNGMRGVEWFFEHQRKHFEPHEIEIVQQWTTLRPRVIQVIGKNDDGLTVEDDDSKEQFFMPYTVTLTDLPPWSTTFCMIEELNGEYFIHGGSPWQGPDFLRALSGKIDELIADTGDPREQVVMDYYPEILSELVENPAKQSGPHEQAQEVKMTTLVYRLHQKEKVIAWLLDHPSFVVSEWEDEEGSLDWIDHWHRYEDSEAPDPIFLGSVYGSIEVDDEVLRLQSMDADHLEKFQSWMKDMSDAVAFEKKDVETMNAPRRIEIQSLRAQMSEETPRYFSHLAQFLLQLNLDRPLPLFGDHPPRELVQAGEEETVDIWLKQQEYQSYLGLRRKFDNLDQTVDFNTPRRSLGLPLSSFVTGGEGRQSSITPCASPIQKLNRITQEDIPYYQALGFDPETKDKFYARDVVAFYKDKTMGKSKATVQKYEKSLVMLVDYLLYDAPDVSSWEECDVQFWEQFLAYEYLATYKDVSVNQAQSLCSTLKAFAKWLDQKDQMALSDVVRPVVARLEKPVCRAIRFLDQYAPYHFRANKFDEMSDLALMLQKISEPEKQFVEGSFQVKKITENGAKVIDMDDPKDKKYSLQLKPKAVQCVYENMIIEGTLSRSKTGACEITDLESVFPGEAEGYFP